MCCIFANPGSPARVLDAKKSTAKDSQLTGRRAQILHIHSRTACIYSSLEDRGVTVPSQNSNVSQLCFIGKGQSPVQDSDSVDPLVDATDLVQQLVEACAQRT